MVVGKHKDTPSTQELSWNTYVSLLSHEEVLAFCSDLTPFPVESRVSKPMPPYGCSRALGPVLTL